MILQRTVAPASLVVTLDDFKRHLGIIEDDDIDLAQQKLEEAISHIDGYSGIYGRAILDQTWQATFAQGCDRTGDGQQGFDIGFGPLIAVTKLEGRVSGTWTEVNAANYTTRALRNGWRIRRTTTGTWPSVDDDEEAWRVTFRAGWTEAASVPLAVLAAIKLLGAHLFEHRGEDDAPIPAAVMRLLSPTRRIEI